jgi:glycosyltransferase involved in cell wall biosynthesis
MNNLPSFLRPISETVVDGATTAISSGGSESSQPTNFADFLRAEAAKAGLLSDDVKGSASAQVQVQVQVQQQRKCKFMLVGTHAHQYTGYSKVTYNMVRELAKEDSWLDLVHFGFQKHPQIPPLYRPYPPQVKVVDAVALEVAAAQGKEPASTFGFQFLPDVIKKEKPDVVMIYNDASVVSQFLEAIRKSAIPRTFKIWVYIDQVYPIQPQPFLDLLNRDADRIFAFTTYWKKVLKEQGINRPIDILAHGFDSAVFKPMSKKEARKMLGIPEDAFIFMSLNRNTPRKRYDLMVMAFAELVVKYPTKPVFLLCICDKGEKGGYLIFDIYLRELRRLGVNVDQYAARLILSAKEMVFRDEETTTFYSVADVQLSASEGEGFGLCSFESMGLGIPCIAPDVGGFKEFMTAENAILVKPTYRAYLPLGYSPVAGEVELVSSHDLSIAMETYLNDTELRERHGKAARETVLKYTWSSVMSNLMKRLKTEHQEILEGAED